MSYEYKDEIIMNLKDYNAGRKVTGGTHAFESKLEELDRIYAQADEYEAKNKELLEELKYLKTVNDDLVWQRDTDEEHEAKAKAFDDIVAAYENNTGLGEHDEDLTDFEAIVDSIEHGIQMVGYRENEEE